MNKKVFMGITMLDEDNNAIKAIGIIHHLETGKIEKLILKICQMKRYKL